MTDTPPSIPTASIPLSQGAIEAWMSDYISQLLSMEKDTIDPASPFDSFGLDSIEAVVMAGVMEEEFGVPIDPTLLLEHPSIRRFAAATCQKA